MPCVEWKSDALTHPGMVVRFLALCRVCVLHMSDLAVLLVSVAAHWQKALAATPFARNHTLHAWQHVPSGGCFCCAGVHALREG